MRIGLPPRAPRATAAPGIGFAIPSNTVKEIARQIIDEGRVNASGRPALGAQVATLTAGGVALVAVAPVAVRVRHPDGSTDTARVRLGELRG